MLLKVGLIIEIHIASLYVLHEVRFLLSGGPSSRFRWLLLLDLNRTCLLLVRVVLFADDIRVFDHHSAAVLVHIDILAHFLLALLLAGSDVGFHPISRHNRPVSDSSTLARLSAIFSIVTRPKLFDVLQRTHHQL